MLRHHTTQGGYSIVFPAYQYWSSDPYWWDTHCGVQQVDELEIGAMCHLFDDILEGLCNPGPCYHHDWFMGQYQRWMTMRQCCRDLQQAAGQSSISGVDTTTALRRQCWESRCPPKSPTLQGYSPIIWTVATPLQLSKSPICRPLLL
jgi:hypothetical protein